MSNRTFYPSAVYGFARVYMEWQFQANAASNPVLTFFGQAGSTPATTTVWGISGDMLTSITYTATGIFTIQLGVRETYYKVVFKMADADDVSADNPGAYATLGNVTGEGYNTTPSATPLNFKLRTYTAGGSAVQLAAGHNLYVTMGFRNSSATNPD
jgi:hypothetical protein